MQSLRAGVLLLLLGVLLVCAVEAGGEWDDVDPEPLINWKWKKRELKFLRWYNHYYAGSFSCEQNCTFDTSEWNPTSTACTSDGTVIGNPLCSSANTFIDCKSSYFLNHPDEPEYSIVSPSSCTCPSDCSDRGTCSFSGCSCDAGYTGDDCKLVQCESGQNCHGRGSCEHMDDLEIDTCVCDDGYATNDCSSKMKELPEIPNLMNVDQYSSWDDYGDDHPIFNESAIAQIYITLDPKDLSDLILPSNQEAKEYKKADFSFYNGAVSERMEKVGFRIKGGASRNFAKKSWKISFSHFEEDRKWAQQKKISLKSAAMDSLYVRERSSFAAIRAMGGPVQRSSYATLYINGQYWGVYVLLEEPGTNQFLKSRFGNDKGSLWKITDANPLNWEGDDPEVYRNDTRYRAMNDHAEKSYKPLINFLDIVNNCPDDEFEAQIQTVMNVEFFFRTFSAEVNTGNWDGVYNGNNYFLYYNTDKLFYYYRYDVDISYGSLEEWFKGATRNIWLWGKNGVGHRLIQRLLSVKNFQNIYADHLTKSISYTDWQGDFKNRVEIMHDELSSPVKDDKWHALDQTAFSYGDFKNNLESPVLRPNFFPPQGIFHNPTITIFEGLSGWLKERVSNIKQQVSDGPPKTSSE